MLLSSDGQKSALIIIVLAARVSELSLLFTKITAYHRESNSVTIE